MPETYYQIFIFTKRPNLMGSWHNEIISIKSPPPMEITVKHRAILRGARYLMGDNLKAVWAEFSTVS